MDFKRINKSYLIALLIFFKCMPNEVGYYSIMKVLPLNLHGWCSPENRKNLKKFILDTQPNIIVELGSWLGLSASVMCESMHINSKLYAIDTWKGSVEHSAKPEFKKFLATLYQQFLSNMIHLKLTDKVIPVRMGSLEAAASLNIEPNMIYVDASHEEEDVYNDIKAWYPKLAKNGIMCGDDWRWKTVQKGVTRIAKELNQKINFEGTFWWFNIKK